MGINQIQSLKGQSLLAPAIILSPAVIIENLALNSQNGVDFGGHRRAFCYEDNEFKAMRGNKKCR